MTASAAPRVSGLTFIQGQPFDVQSLVGKKVIVLECFASWCGPCKAAAPHMTSLAEQYKKRDVVFLGISDEKPDVVAKFVSQLGSKMSYNVASDSQQHCMAEFQRRYNKGGGIPAAFIIDHTGAVKDEKSFHPRDSQFEAALDVAANQLRIHNAKTQQQQQARSSAASSNWSSKPRDEIAQHSIKELKQYMSDHSIDATGCLEKAELIEKIMTSFSASK